MTRRIPLLLVALGPAALPGCSDTTSVDMTLPGGNTLVFVDAGELDPVRGLLRSLVDSIIPRVRAELPVTNVRIAISADVTAAISGIGLGGRSPDARTVNLAIDMALGGIADTLRRYLPLLLAHELHHAMRHRSPAGYGTTLFEAMVSEGLADRFGVEVTLDDPPPWSVALSDSSAAVWLANARPVWDSPEYDHDGWFFGSDPTIPRWTGYALGWRLVVDYQGGHGERASDLWAAPASAFLPAGLPRGR
jgi:hypothetical protein